jgi:glucose-6-phosphate isomerase
MDTTVTLPSTLQEAVDGALASAIEQRWASRIWARDTSLWTDEESVAASIAHRLGWLDAPTAFAEEVAELTAFGEQIAQEGYTDVLVCGMGGSSLAPEVLSRVYPESDKGLDIHVLDSTDPAAVAAYDALLDPARTLRIIATKSGSTTETLALLAHHWEAEEHRVGRFPRTKAGNGFVSVADPGGLREAIPHASYFRETFLNPADVGGRYSALTYVGLVPAALLWLDLDPLLEDARIMATATRADSLDNPALVLGVALATLAKAGRDKLTLVIEPDLAPLGAWLEQLIAESTGKQGKGIVPVDGEPLAAPERYADDRVFVRLGPADAAEWHSQTDPALAALVATGHPLIDIRLDEASWVAAEFFRWEFATAVAGVALGVNPFDEPNVTESKHNTGAVLDVFAREGRLPAPEPSASLGSLKAWRPGAADVGLVELLRQHIGSVAERGYFSIGAFIAPTEARTQLLRALQADLRDGTGRATTFGYGPRFLHSTGQLHKGGAPTGCFIQLTCGHPVDIDIPGRHETFGVLVDAQAMGDLAALAAHGLPALRIDLGEDADGGLGELLAAVSEALA